MGVGTLLADLMGVCQGGQFATREKPGPDRGRVRVRRAREPTIGDGSGWRPRFGSRVSGADRPAMRITRAGRYFYTPPESAKSHSRSDSRRFQTGVSDWTLDDRALS